MALGGVVAVGEHAHVVQPQIGRQPAPAVDPAADSRGDLAPLGAGGELLVDLGHAHHGAAVELVHLALLKHVHEVAHGASDEVGLAFALGAGDAVL